MEVMHLCGCVVQPATQNRTITSTGSCFVRVRKPLLMEVPPQPWLTSFSVALPVVTKLFLISSDNFTRPLCPWPLFKSSVTTENSLCMLSLLVKKRPSSSSFKLRLGSPPSCFSFPNETIPAPPSCHHGLCEQGSWSSW